MKWIKEALIATASASTTTGSASTGRAANVSECYTIATLLVVKTQPPALDTNGINIRPVTDGSVATKNSKPA